MAAQIMDASIGRWESACISDVGRVRKLNEDSYLDRSDLGVWVVADGMGGHSSGDVASQSICNALADMPNTLDLSSAVDFIDDNCSRINSQLVAMARENGAGVVIGSTVVALVSRGGTAVCLWAGDSRLYRLRSGALQQLSEDHSFEGLPGSEQFQDHGHIITRAVGADDELFLDIDAVHLQPGDRFLLCSDGLSNELDLPRLAEALQSGSVQECCERLVQEALVAGGSDNVTALVTDFLST